MHLVQQHIAFAEERGLFRAATAWIITTSLLQRAGRNFHWDLPKVSRCDVFISHSWSCAKWIKLLAVCHYLNLDVAIVLSVLAGLLNLVLFVVHAGNWSGVAQLSQGLLYAGLAFIAQSSKMLILWDDTIFERLWCNYELAIYAKTSYSAGAFEVLPMWVPMWTLALSAIELVFFGLVFFYQQEVPSLDTTSQSSIIVSAMNAYFLPPFVFLAASVPVSWFCFHKLKLHKLMLDQMSQFDIRNAKCSLETDRVVLTEQVVSLFDEEFDPHTRVAFDVQDDDALVAASSQAPLMSSPDFPEIENVKHVTSYPTKDEIVDRFNTYVRGTLRDSIVASLGEEDHISFDLCVGTCLPLLFFGLKATVDCEGHVDCLEPAAKWGLDSANQFSLLDGFFNLAIYPLCFLILCPLMLRANHFVAGIVQDTLPRMVLGSLLCTITMFTVYSLCVLECAFCFVVVTKYSHAFLLAFSLGLVGLLWTTWFLFFRTSQ
eukprot:Skav223747  [mRNA]  locus=scaffold3575:191369:194407:- [translate_table: standard]